MKAHHPLKVMVLAGGPDREREVSLESGRAVAEGLTAAGHEVRQHDILPEDLSALDAFVQWGGHVIFPALHGAWGEGGRLQRILDQRELAYVGSGAAAAELAMDKRLSKLVFETQGVPTPPFEFVRVGERIDMPPPVVVKPHDEGSSIGVHICRDADAIQRARQALSQRHHSLLIERYVEGSEMTIGLIGGARGGGYDILPALHVMPASDFYDYEAKYQRDDTRYRFDIDLPAEVLEQLGQLALRAHKALGCRHLSRVDFIIDREHRPWCLEVNTMPGFTSHSLLPKAAARAGLAWPQLLDRLVHLPLAGHAHHAARGA